MLDNPLTVGLPLVQHMQSGEKITLELTVLK